MTWHVVHLDDVAPAPWKNGGGTTRELVAWPDSEHWAWRMSVAEVAQSGPFSRFDGVQRWFAVLGGAGVALTHNGTRQALTAGSAPFCFDGGALTDCDLLDGATQDFNLLARLPLAVPDAAGVQAPGVALSAVTGATMTRIRGSAIVNACYLAEHIKIIAIYSIRTLAKACFNDNEVLIPPRCLVWRVVAAQDVITTVAEDALLIEIDMPQEVAIRASEASQASQVSRSGEAASSHATTNSENAP